MKNTKRSLLLSALALVICVTMLIGSTFAWFTDSVTSASNIIKSGTLDVTMEWADGKEAVDGANWTDASTGAIFDYDLWEPGYTEVRHIKIANVGNLALKYQLNILANGEVSALADVIDVFYVDPAMQIADRAALTEDMKIGTLTEVLAAISSTASGTLLAGEEHTITLALKMQETAGNEYQGLAIGSDFTVQLMATQLTYEEDSYNDQYDNITLVANEAELAAAVAAGGNVMLTNDVAVNANSTITVADGVETVLILNGHTISGVSTQINENKKIFTVKGEMTVVGNGFITYLHAGENAGWGKLFSAFSVEGGVLTLDKGVVVINNGGTNMAYGVDVNTTLGESILNVNGATILSTYTAVREFNNNKTAKAIVNYNSGVINGDSRDIWVHNPSASAVDANGIVNIADGIDTTMTTQDASSYYGRIYNIEYGYVLVVGQAALQKALDNAVDGTKIVLATDFVGNVTVPQKANTKITIDGNGKKFDGTLLVDGKSSTITTAGVVIKNVNFTSATADACIQLGKDNNTRYTCNVTIENCTFDAVDKVGVKSYTGGDKNLVIRNCTATANAHSLAQLKGVDGVVIENCTVNSVRGINFNNSFNVKVDNCAIDVQKYAVRFGESANDVVENYAVTNCTISSANVEGDAAIVLRAGATNAKLDITNTTITAGLEMSGYENANIIK